MRCLLVVFALVLWLHEESVAAGGGGLWGPLLAGAVSSRGGNKRGSPRATDPEAPVDVSSFDAEGELPLFKTARRLLGKASPVVALRFCEVHETEGRKRGNGTLLAWGFDVTSPFEIRMHAQTLSSLGHPYQRLLVTGVAGDCRIVSRFVKQTALNHTVEFNSFASGAHLATQLAEFMQSAAMNGDRPLVCHALICSGIDATLHSIEPSCQVTEVTAANAGREADLGKRLLDAEYRSNVTLDEALGLARRIVNPPPKGGAGPDDEKPESKELGLEFCVIYDDED